MLFFRGKQIPRCARDDRNGVVQTFPSAAQARPRAALPRPRIAIQPAGCRTMTPMPDTLPDWLAWIERQHPRSIDMGLERVREVAARMGLARRSEEHTSELQSLMRLSYAVFRLK